MSKAYPSNLTRAEYEFLSDLIPEPKLGGRPRTTPLYSSGEILVAKAEILTEQPFQRSL